MLFSSASPSGGLVLPCRAALALGPFYLSENKFAHERKLVQAQIDAVNITLENLVNSLSQLSTPALVKAVEANYATAQSEKERLVGDLGKFQQESDYLELLRQLRANYHHAVDEWELYSRDEQRAMLLMFVQSVEVIRHDARTTELVVRWRDHTSDSVILRKRGGKAEGWLTSELEQLQKFVRDRTPRVEVAAAFPNRSWKAIVHAVRRTMGIYYGVGRKEIHDEETYTDYLNRTSPPVLITSDTHLRSRRR